ncbi:MAG TPA: pilus assembly protein PilM [Tepidisphaeraceae bacterium]|jgi:type IV pilus assembly protein PilM
MLGFVNNWFAPKCNPIGIDFGSDCLRLAQVQWTGEDYKLIAAASADVPPHVRTDANARSNFFIETVKDLLAQAPFRGRQCVLALPAATMFVRHLRMPKLDDDAMKKALPWELRGKLPIDPLHAVLRHVIAGEVYQDQDPKYEVIVLAAARDRVNQLLGAAHKAKLDVIGMNVEPKAIIDCFSNVYRRKSDETATSCYIDIGCTSSRAVITHGSDMSFARVIPIGGDQFSRAVSEAMKISLQDAKILRVKLASQQTTPLEEIKTKIAVAPENATPARRATDQSPDNSFALLDSAMRKAEQNAAPAPAPAEAPVAPPAVEVESTPVEADQAQRAMDACQEPLRRLVEELNLSRRYYESTFPEKPIDRLIFIGGEARQRALCQQVAREMGLAAQIGDPLVRMGRISDISVESGIDRRQPQPSWAVAIGLSMGPKNGAGDNTSSNEMIEQAAK